MTYIDFLYFHGGLLSIDLMNKLDSDFASVGVGDPGLFLLDTVNQAVIVGYGSPVYPASIKLYVNYINTNPTPPDSEIACLQTRLDFQPTADTAANVTGGYFTTWLNAAATYSGGPVAVRGNLYLRNQGAGLVNVSDYVAGGIFRVRQEALGVVNMGVAVLADAAQQGSIHGTFTKTIGVRVDGTAVGIKNYGIYYFNHSDDGCLASSAGVDITVSPAEGKVWAFRAAGWSNALSGDTGVLQFGDWGEGVETLGAITGFSANIYTKRSDGTYHYRNTHASVGGALMLHNYAAFQTTSFLYAPPGTAGAAATLTEALRVTNTPAANTTSLSLAANNGGAVFRNVEIGAADSGGTGYRMLRVLN